MIYTNTAVSLRAKLRSIELSQSQLILQLKSDTFAYPWHEILRPTILHKKPFNHALLIDLRSENKSVKYRFSADKSCQLQLDYFWYQAHKTSLINRVSKIESLLKHTFLSRRKWLLIKESVQKLAHSWLNRQLECEVSLEVHKAMATLKELYHWCDKDIEEFKTHFIAHKMSEHQHFFNRLETHPLTDAQQKACIIQDDRQLLLAGAGTGKTSVINAKYKYLLHTNQAKSDEILVLAYGSDACQELQQRLNSDCQIHTFHSLGKHIISEVTQQTPKVSELATNIEAKTAFIIDTLQALYNEANFKTQFNEFLQRHLNFIPIDDGLSAFIDSPVKKKFIQLIFTLISLYKNNQALNQIECLEGRYSEDLTLIRYFLIEYKLFLKNENAIDFDDMVIAARQCVLDELFSANWKYILVDEFQDISPIRAEFLKTLLASKVNSQLFAVGDDWQSIYRFNGGDIRYVTQFAEHFGEATTTQLDKTFRYSQALLNLSCEFVCRNPKQLTKSIYSLNNSRLPPVKTIHYAQLMQGVSEALGYIASMAPVNASLLLLARNHATLLGDHTLSAIQQHYQQLSINQMTFHASKGKEADYTLLMGLDSQSLPSRVKSPSILEALLPEPERFPDAEERRLFYVALTRAKKQVILLVPDKSPSEFIKELNL